MPRSLEPKHIPGHRSAKSVPNAFAPSDYTSDIEPFRLLRASLPPIPTRGTENVEVEESDKDTIKQLPVPPPWNLCLSEGYINAVRSRLGGLLFRQFVSVIKKYELDT